MRRRRRRRANVIPPLTSMGDIAFLVIAFFVLAAQFNKNLNKNLEQPESADIDKLEKVPPVQIIVESRDKHGIQKIWLNEEEIQSLDALEGKLAAAMVGRDDESRRVVMRCDKETPQEIYQGILEAIAANSLPVAMSGDEPKKKSKTNK